MTTALPLMSIMKKATQVLRQHRQVLSLLILFLRVGGWAMTYMMTNYLEGLPLLFENGSVIVDPEVLSTNDPLALRQIFQPYILTISVMLLVVILVFMLIQIFVMDMTFSTLRNMQKNYQDMVRTTFAKLTPYLSTSVVQSFFLVILYLLLIIPGIIYSIYRLFTTAVVVFSDKKHKAAMDESKRIVQGRWWKTTIYIIVITFLFSLTQGVIGWLLSYIPQVEIMEGLLSLVSNIFQILIMVVVACFFMVWYDTALPQEIHDEA